MSDLISRDEAIKAARLMIGLTADERENEIRAIPTIEERKKGEWLDNKWLGKSCSVCGWKLPIIDFGQCRYCLYCGAEMERSEECY